MSLLTRRLDRLQAELDARNMVKREPIVRQVPCWQDPQEYLDQVHVPCPERDRGDGWNHQKMKDYTNAKRTDNDRS